MRFRRLHRRTGHTFADLARRINPIVWGWMLYYGAYHSRKDRTEYAPSDVRAGNTTDHGTQPAGRTRQVPVAVGPGRLLKAHFESRRQPAAPMTR